MISRRSPATYLGLAVLGIFLWITVFSKSSKPAVQPAKPTPTSLKAVGDSARGALREHGRPPPPKRPPPKIVGAPKAAAKAGGRGDSRRGPGKQRLNVKELSGNNPPLPRVKLGKIREESDAALQRAQELPEDELELGPVDMDEPDELSEFELPDEVAAMDNDELAAISEDEFEQILAKAELIKKKPAAAAMKAPVKAPPAEADDSLDAAQRGNVKPAGRRVMHKGAVNVADARGAPRVAQPAPVRKNNEWAKQVKQKQQQLPFADASASSDADVAKHPLVRRLITRQFERTGHNGDEHPVILKAPFDAPEESYNMTVCTMIGDSARFLPEWLLYHRLLGVERFMLYDVEPSAKADLLEGEMLDSNGLRLGANARRPGPPGAAKGGVPVASWSEKLAGLEDTLDQGLVQMHWLKRAAGNAADDSQARMINHCSETYSSTSHFLMHLSLDEFIVVADSLYGANQPYQTVETGSSAKTRADPSALPFYYPLHDILNSESVGGAACVPIPALHYRNYGVRKLKNGESVIGRHTIRETAMNVRNTEKIIIHPALTSGFVDFAQTSSCTVRDSNKVPKGVTAEIRDSQGQKLQVGGQYKSVRLPSEPLVVARYLQRDLAECYERAGASTKPGGQKTAQRACDREYLPSPDEMTTPAFTTDKKNADLMKIPPAGVLVEDTRVKSSWTARAVRHIVTSWAVSPPSIAPRTASQIEAARAKIILVEP